MVRHVPLRAALAFICCLTAVSAHAQNTITRNAYAATVDATGALSSVRVGNCELLRSPLEFCPGAKWTPEKRDVSSDGANLTVSLRSERGTGEVAYRFEQKRLVASLRQKLGGFQSWQVTFGDDVLAVDDLQNRDPGGAEAIQYVDRGTIYPMPTLSISRLQRARLYLRNGATVLFWHDGWGAPFNLDEMGGISGYTYRRNLLENDKPMHVYFQVERGPGKPLRPAPRYALKPVRFGSAFYPDDFVANHLPFELTLPDGQSALMAVGSKWRFTCVLRDLWGRTVDTMRLEVDASTLRPDAHPAVSLANPGPGWYTLKASLTPVKPAAPVVPSEYTTRFAVIGRAPGLAPRPEPGERLDDYSASGLMGLRCVRESHVMREYFPERGKSNTQALEELFARAEREAKQNGVQWFFQANERPAWCTDAEYEQVAYDLVSAAKGRCKVWEVENEPNFRMKPEEYVTRCLIPFAKGAKRADPTCQVIGPACVSVPLSLEFMQAIIKAGALSYLDGVSTHTYVGPGEPWELFGNPQYLARLRDLAGDRPLWQTEQGYSWGHISKREHARYVVRQFLNGWAAGIAPERHFYFYPVHNGFEPWYLMESGGPEPLNGTLEPAGVALRVMSEQLADGKASALMEPVPGVYALRFRGPEHDVIALWTLDYPVPLMVRSPGKNVTMSAVDIMGQPKRLGDGRSLTVDGYPTYLRVPRGARVTLSGPALGNACRPSAVTASSTSKDHPAANVTLDRWSLRDPVPGMAERVFWEADTPGPSEQQPAWLQLDLGIARTIHHVRLLSPNPAIDAVPRDFRIDVSNDGRTWRTVAARKDQVGWAWLLGFQPTRARYVRLVITRLNDGWHLGGRWMPMIAEDFTRYTSMKARVLALEAYGQ